MIIVSLIVIILKAVCFKNKPVVMETTLSVAECTVNAVVTEDNTAYGCSQLDPVIPAESTMYETLDLEESTKDKGQKSTEKPLTRVNATYALSPNVVYNITEGAKVNTEKDIVTSMVQNVAYEETTVHLSPNMAYNTHQFERETEEEVEYTYVSS